MPVIKGVDYVVRFGSKTDLNDTITNGGNRIEINTINGIKNSANKRLMKECFNRANVKTADWWTYQNNIFHSFANEISDHNIEHLPYPIVAKHIFGSRGEGNYKLDTQEQLEAWMNGKNLSNYIFEKFYSYLREYRLHVSKNGCFYACRKMLKTGTPNDQKWSRHDDNCVWIIEENPLFDKPVNWNNIVEDCVKALQETGLDIGAFDVKVQSTNKQNNEPRENPEYILIEVNSAPSHGDRTTQEYIKETIKLIKNKYING
jgi:D-alanine-D-alanine ligase-like ATP-grasp enzyme